MLRPLLFTLTHCVSDLLLAHLQTIRRAWPGDFVVVLDARASAASPLPAHLNDTLWTTHGLQAVHMRPAFPGCYTDKAGNEAGGFDLVISFLASQLTKGYRFFVHIENDVYIPASAVHGGLLRMIEAAHDTTTDLFTLREPWFEQTWHWFHRDSDGCRQLPQCGLQHANVIMPTTVFRASSRMAAALVDYAARKQCAYREVFVPAVALRSNMTLRAWPRRRLVESHQMCGAHCRAHCPTGEGLVHPLKMCTPSTVCASAVASINNVTWSSAAPQAAGHLRRNLVDEK